MRLLLIESSPDFCRVLENVLARGEFRVQSLSNPEQGWSAYQQTHSDMILMELPVDVVPVEKFLEKLRKDRMGSTVPVVLMSEVHHKDSKIVSRITQSFQIQEFLPRPFEMFGIAKRLRVVGEAPKQNQSAAPSTAKPRPRVATRPASTPLSGSPSRSGNFRTLLAIWQQEKTGILRSRGDGNWVSIYSGGLQSEGDKGKVKELLLRPNMEFQELQQDGEGDPARTGTLLWEEALGHVPVSFEIQLDKRFAVLTEKAHLIAQLPVDDLTRKLLKLSKSHTSTKQLLDESNIDAQNVVPQLGALRALGLIRLEPIASRPIGRRPTNPPPATRPKLSSKTAHSPGPRPQADPSPALVLKRLKSELQRLENADPYTILGLPRDCGADLLHGATQRMESRYSMQSRDPALPKAARKIAAKLAQLVVEAETAILSAQSQPSVRQTEKAPKPKADQPPDSMEELAFSEGTKAFAAGDFARATKCFRKARDERIDSVRNLAWLGWAIFHYSELPKDERIEESTDLLRLAVSFDPSHRQAQFFLAYVESMTDQVDAAMNRLQALVKVHPDHREAKKLLHMLVNRSR